MTALATARHGLLVAVGVLLIVAASVVGLHDWADAQATEPTAAHLAYRAA